MATDEPTSATDPSPSSQSPDSQSPGSQSPDSQSPESQNSASPSPDSRPLKDRVQEVIDEMINPAVAMHGGVISLVDVKDTAVYIHMGGGCQGCAMSKMTLKAGIESMLLEEIPEVTEVIDATEHAEGENPYFA